MMNRFRKILSAALAGCMAVSALMMSAGAANTGTEAAREKAIYGSQAWTVNGAAAIQHSDGTVRAGTGVLGAVSRVDSAEASGFGIEYDTG